MRHLMLRFADYRLLACNYSVRQARLSRLGLEIGLDRAWCLSKVAVMGTLIVLKWVWHHTSLILINERGLLAHNTHARARTPTHAHARTRTYADTHGHTHTHTTHIHAHARTHARATRARTHACARRHMRAHSRTHANNTHAYTHAHIQTHINTHWRL